MRTQNTDIDRALNGLSEAMRRGAYARSAGKAYSDCPFHENSRVGRAWKIGYEAALEAETYPGTENYPRLSAVLGRL